MKNWKKTIILGSTVLIVAVVALMILKILFVDFVVDFWWFQSQQMTLYFLLRMLYRYISFLLYVIFFFAIFYANFWIASKYLNPKKSSAYKNE